MGNYKNRMSSADALKLAYKLLDTPSVDAVGKLPQCYFGKNDLAPPMKTDPLDDELEPADEKEMEETHESLDDVDFFTIHQAMSNIATNFMFNADIVDPKTGIVVATNSKLRELNQSGYLKAPLQYGFVILEVNDKAFTSLSD